MAGGLSRSAIVGSLARIDQQESGGPGCKAGGPAMINKLGTREGNRHRFSYEPRVVGGKLLMPAELQAIHRYVIETPSSKPSRRNKAVVKSVWPELISKLPTKA